MEIFMRAAGIELVHVPYKRGAGADDSFSEDAIMTKDRIGGLFLLFIGIWVSSLSIKLPIGSLAEPGPALFPLSLSILLSITGILIFVSGKGKTKIDWRMDFRKMAKPSAIILLTLAFIIFMGRLGYLVTSVLYLFSLFFLVCRFRLFAAVILSGILAAGSWYLFGNILGIQLPPGPWNL
jgi:putative tricarboxylic transport membrane protein